MKPTIYLAHSSKVEYETTIYAPVRSAIKDVCNLILPHENNKKPEYSLPIIKNSDAIIAFIDEVSEARAMEIGFAVAFEKPIALVHNTSKSLPTSAYSFFPDGTFHWIEYSSQIELEEKLAKFVKRYD